MKTLFSNARVVLAAEIVETSLCVEDGLILAVGGGTADGAEVVDCEGDLLIPGLIDLHTDNVERHFGPRPRVTWPAPLAAVLTHDREMVTAGITTVLDSISVGDWDGKGLRTAMLGGAIRTIAQARLKGLLKAEHYLHLRCELGDPDMLQFVQGYFDDPHLRLVSLMDHTPGQRQWRDLDLFRNYNQKKSGRIWTDDEFAAFLDKARENQRTLVPVSRDWIATAAKARSVPLASHDDSTAEDVNESHSTGVTVSEFPTSIAAAQRAHALGMQNIMGAPNVVLGGSHSGNIAAADLSDAGLLDILASDYVPSSMLQAPFVLMRRGVPLPAAIAMVTSAPARAAGFSDRGRIAEGLRADLVRVRLIDEVAVPNGVWVAGRRCF